MIVAAVTEHCSWLRWSGEQRRRCVEQDDYLDGVSCALIARAAARGLLDDPLPEGEELEQARREGWMFLPAAESLSHLNAAQA